MMDSTAALDGGASSYFESDTLSAAPAAGTDNLSAALPAPPLPAPRAAIVPAAAAAASKTASSFQDLDLSSGSVGGAALGNGGHPASGARFDATASLPPAAGGASPDLAVVVGSPSKVGEGMSAFFTYEVRTKTSLPQYVNSEFAVTRRFRDFDWLHTQLVATFPGAIVPPLPEKHAAQVATYKVTAQQQSAAFLEERRSQLQRFLQRLVAHPMIHTAPDLQAFLEKPDDELEQWREKAKGGALGTKAYSLQDVKSGLLKMANSSLSMTEMPPASFLPLADVPCQQMGNYAAAVQAQVASVHKHARGYIERHKALGTALTGFGLTLTQLADCQRTINESLANGISSMGLCVGRLSATYHELAEREKLAFDEPMKEYVRILSSAKAAIACRDAAVKKYNEAQLTMLLKKERLEKHRAAGGKEEKAAVLSGELAVAEESTNLAKAEYEAIAARVDAEMARFQAEKLADLKRIVINFISLQIEYSVRVQQAWRELLPRLQAIEVGSDALPSGAPPPRPIVSNFAPLE
jgi:sorting nexin-1/2